MSNGHIEIHDPFSSSSRTMGRTGDEPASDKMEDNVEFRLLMVCADRRRPGNFNNNGDTASPLLPPSDTVDAAKPVKIKKKKKKKKVFMGFFKCIKAQKEDEPEENGKECLEGHLDKRVNFRSAALNNEGAEEDLEEVVNQIIKVAEKIPFLPPEVEVDSPEEDEKVAKLIGLLLREHGDRLNETEELKQFLRSASAGLTYAFFEKLMQTLLRSLGLWNQDPDAPKKEQIAVTFEVTSRLSTADTLPMNRLLGYGATYLQNHFSPWVKQRGGYDEVFKSEEEEEEEEEEEKDEDEEVH